MPKYEFHGKASHDGNPGEIPEIWLEREDELPSIEAAASVELNQLYRNAMEASKLRIVWQAGGGGGKKVNINAECEIRDRRFQCQLGQNEFTDQLLEWLIDCSGKLLGHHKPLLIKRKLPESAVPLSIMPYILQAITWIEFIAPLKEGQVINQRYAAQVVGEYYYLSVRSCAFRLPEEFRGRREDDFEAIFDFDPANRLQRPTIEKDCIWWNLTDKKIKIILSHAEANEGLTTYYNYREIYNRFLVAQKENKDKNKIREESWRKQQQEETEERKNKLRKFLLG